MANIDPLKTIQCFTCTKYFSNERTLKSHVKSVHEEKLFSCKYCAKKFATLGNLKCHEDNIHKDGGKHQCVQCDESFKTAGRLGEHMRVFHDALKLKCDFCGKGYLVQKSLTKHISEKHSGPSQWICQHCDHSFVNRESLVKHISSVHEKIRFKCKFCEQDFSRKQNRKSHEDIVHLGKVPPKKKCSFCPMEYARQSALMTHLNRFHPDDLPNVGEIDGKDARIEHLSSLCEERGRDLLDVQEKLQVRYWTASMVQF